MAPRSRTYVRNGQLYTSHGAGFPPVPSATMKPAVVTVDTYIAPSGKKPPEPREVTPDDIFAEMEKLTIRPSKRR